MISVSYKQYYISPRRISLTGMIEISWKDVYVYVGDDLEINIYVDSVGRKYLVLGDVYSSSSFCSIKEIVSKFNGSDIIEMVETWTGRWLLIGEDEILADACALMPVFYSDDKDWFISSSLALICGQRQLKISNEVSDEGVTWQILPYSLLDGICTLFCTQKIQFAKLGINIKSSLWIKDYSSLSLDDKVNKLTTHLKTSLSNIESYSNRKIWVALTAGKDSRLVLAAAVNSGVHFNAFTLHHNGISYEDKTLPRKIVRSYDVFYNYIKSKRRSKQKEKEYLIFNSYNSKGADLQFYSRGQDDLIPDDAIVIRGGIFEAGQTFGRSILNNNIDSFYDDYTHYYSESFTSRKQQLALSEWLQYAKDFPIDFIDIRDRFYIEQRVGGWVAALEQALSINKWNSIQLANNREVISILLSATAEEREKLLLTNNSIRVLDNRLLNYSINKHHIIDDVKYYIRKLFQYRALLSYLRRKLK